MISNKMLMILVSAVSIMVCASAVIVLSNGQDGDTTNADCNDTVANAEMGSPALTVQTWQSGDCTCTLYDDGLFTVSGNGAMADYTSSSHAPWYDFRASITSVVLQHGVTTIGNYAFENCTSLASVTIPNSVTSIGGSAFAYCTSLTSVTIPNSVTTIGNYAFVYCTSLASVTIPNSVTSIGDSAFAYCTSLASVTIPNSVTSIGVCAFYGCTSLTNIFFLSTTWKITYIGADAFSSGKSSHPVTATVHSPNNIVNGKLDAYKGNYTTLTYTASSQHTYNINVNPSGYGTVSPTSIQIWDGTSLTEDGNILRFTDGQTVTATPSPATAQYKYAFDNWTFGNLSQTANFTRSTQEYTITFQSADTTMGTVSEQSVNVDYGAQLWWSWIDLDPRGAVGCGSATLCYATPNEGYFFDRWEGVAEYPDYTVVESNMTLTAYFSRETITFQSADTTMGTVSEQSCNVQNGAQITYHGDGSVERVTFERTTLCIATPNEGFLFDYWEGVALYPETTTVTGDITLIAHFKPQFHYRVAFESNNAEYGSVSTDFLTISMYNTIAVADNVITITDQYTNATYTITATPSPATAQYTYVFDSWSGVPEGGVVAQDITITANFTRTQNIFTVTVQVDPEHPDWGDVDKSSFADIPYGTQITQVGNILQIGNEEPYMTQEATPQPASEPYRYLFNSWSGIPESGKVTEDITVTAIFQQTEEYIITFKSNNPDFGNPDKYEVTAQVGTAVTVSKNKITIGSGLGSETVTAVPSPSTPEYLYTFVDWSDVPETITGDVTITANFDQTVQTYRVSFDVNNHSWGSVTPTALTVDYGTIIYMEHNTIHFPTLSITVVATPKQPTVRYDYAFDGWDGVPESGLITGATVITANFVQTVHQYTLTIVTDPQDGSYGTVTETSVKVDAGSVIVVDRANLRIGGNVITTAEPKQDTVQYIYIFDNWIDVPTEEILEDYTITAHFTREVRTYTVTVHPADGTRGSVLVDGEGILTDISFVLPFGTAIVKDGPTIMIGDDIHNIVAESKGDYTFIKWIGVPEDAVIKGNIEISTQFETVTIILSSDKMYCVSGMEAPWQYNPFTASLNMPTEGFWSIEDPNRTGLTIDINTGVFGGIIKSSGDFGQAIIKVVFKPLDSDKEISATFTLYYEPQLIVVG